MAIELGAKFGMIAPDETTLAYLAGRAYAPAGVNWDAALPDWRALASDADAEFDAEWTIDVSAIDPQITWGTSPEHVIGVRGTIPSLDETRVRGSAASRAAALDYVGLEPGVPIAGTAIDLVFIGSCTNGRLSDLRSAAEVVGSRRIAPGVAAWVVPGSAAIKAQAEREGLDRIFTDAGFRWGSPGCSMCAGAGDQMREIAAPKTRIVSTTNRNFIGRQGPGTRTHLASPATAAAAALAGAICDVRDVVGIHA